MTKTENPCLPEAQATVGQAPWLKLFDDYVAGRITRDEVEQSLRSYVERTGYEANRPDTVRGLYKKYDVRRVNDPEGKHAACDYFVLDPQHDSFAKDALRAYADACEAQYPQLAADLRARHSLEQRRSDATPEAMSDFELWIHADALSDDILCMVHAFSDEGRREEVRKLAEKARFLGRRGQRSAAAKRGSE